jgi:soluble lytic murein transglycosylase-like protein
VAVDSLSELDVRFRRSRRRAAARRREPRRRSPLAWRSARAVALSLVLLAVVAESTRVDGLHATARPAAKRPAAPTSGCPVPVAFRLAFRSAAAETGVPVSLLAATAYEESRMDPNARSEAGASGLLQLLPGTAREVGLEASDPAVNVLAGARYLRQQLDRFGDLELALAAYNAGPTAVERAGGATPTLGSLRYAKNIEARAALVSGC